MLFLTGYFPLISVLFPNAWESQGLGAASGGRITTRKLLLLCKGGRAGTHQPTDWLPLLPEVEKSHKSFQDPKQGVSSSHIPLEDQGKESPRWAELTHIQS